MDVRELPPRVTAVAGGAAAARSAANSASVTHSENNDSFSVVSTGSLAMFRASHGDYKL